MSSIYSFFAGWWNWFGAFFGKNASRAKEVLESVSKLIDVALPIVEDIDQTIKQFLKVHSHQPGMIYDGIVEFLQLRGVPESESREAANTLRFMPTADILVNLALLLLQRNAAASAGYSLLRLAIELAYNIYKGTRDD